jgi:hypothetical protein
VAEQEVNNTEVMASCRVVKLCLNYLREIQNTSFDVLSEGPSSDYMKGFSVFNLFFK